MKFFLGFFFFFLFAPKLCKASEHIKPELLKISTLKLSLHRQTYNEGVILLISFPFNKHFEIMTRYFFFGSGCLVEDDLMIKQNEGVILLISFPNKVSTNTLRLWHIIIYLFLSFFYYYYFIFIFFIFYVCLVCLVEDDFNDLGVTFGDIFTHDKYKITLFSIKKENIKAASLRFQWLRWVENMIDLEGLKSHGPQKT